MAGSIHEPSIRVSFPIQDFDATRPEPELLSQLRLRRIDLPKYTKGIKLLSMGFHSALKHSGPTRDGRNRLRSGVGHS
jgi:hypothetical protein